MTQPFIPVFKVMPNPHIGAAVQAVYDTGYIGQGEQCAEFERQFGEIIGAPTPPLLLNSCTSAIDLALHLCGMNDGHTYEVITTPITCTATNSPPALRHARLVFADVDPLTGNIDKESVLQRITNHTKAVLAVNWGGRSCDPHHSLDGLKQLCNDLSIPIIEDAAHGPYGRHYGDYVCYSFQAIKHLTMGNGGALITPPDQHERAKLLRWYGLDRESSADFRCAQNIQEIGYKYQSNDILAAIGLANLPHFAASVQACRSNAEYYCRWLADLPGIEVPPFDPQCAYWLMTLCVDDRADFIAHLAERGIGSSQVHARNDKHDAFKAVGESRGPLPGVDAFDARQVSIPVGSWVSEAQREYIAATIATWALNRWRRAA